MSIPNGEIVSTFSQSPFKTKNLVEVFTYERTLPPIEPEDRKAEVDREYDYHYSYTILIYKIDQGYRVEMISHWVDDEFYYHPGIFTSVEDAQGFAEKSTSFDHCELYCEGWLGSLHSDVTEWGYSHYKGWFIWDTGDYELEAYDPLTNRQYIRENLQEIYKLIDTIQAARCEPSLVLT